MTNKEFKTVARLLKQVYLELEKQAISEGIDIMSKEYDELVDKARLSVLENSGFTLDEYRLAKDANSTFTKDSIDKNLSIMEESNSKLEYLKNIHIPTKEEIIELAHNVAKEYIKPPQITNQIVKEITKEVTIEKPQIIETTREVIKKEGYNPKPLEDKLEKINKKLGEIKIPKEIDIEKLSEKLRSDWNKDLEHNINILGMPDFRKLAMGLQSQIDNLGSGSGTPAGSNTEIQYNNSGVVGASPNLTFDGSLETLTANSLGTSQVSTKGIRLINNTAATALAPTQITPPFIFKSYAWRTDTLASQYGEIRIYSKPITGAGSIPPRLIIEGSRNGAAFTDMLRIWDNGNLEVIQAINVNGTVGTDGQVLISKAGAANQWSSTIPWSFVSASAPTTLSGYGITDALVSSQGVYTPTLTNINNVASSTMRPTQWVKVGNTVHLYGTFEITPSSATTKTDFTITIPVASTNGFANIYEAGGTANALHPDDEAGGVPMPVTIWADNGTWTNNQSIYMKYSAVSSSNAVFSFHLSYTIDPLAE